jgi:hypothetical protein
MCAWTAATAEPNSRAPSGRTRQRRLRTLHRARRFQKRASPFRPGKTAAFPVIEQRTATARTAYERLINEQFVVGVGAAGAHVADSMAATPMTVPNLFEIPCLLANGRRRGCSG